MVEPVHEAQREEILGAVGVALIGSVLAAGYRDDLTLHWTDPRGRLLRATPVKADQGPWVRSSLEIPADSAPGEWAVDVRYQRDPIARYTFRLGTR